MSGRKWSALLSLVALLSVRAFADDAKKPDEAAKEVQCKLSKEGKKCCARACTVNFRQALGVPFDYLSGLGVRIHDARTSPDPVDLALAAESLAVAEKVSGKKAEVTADEIRKEAIELTKRRNLSAELQAVAAIVSDSALKSDLSKLAATAAKDEEGSKAASDSGESTREIFGTLRVINHSSHCLRIFIDGQFVGEVHAGQTGHLHAHAHGHHNHLEAFCEEGGELVTCSEFHGHSHFLTWHISD